MLRARAKPMGLSLSYIHMSLRRRRPKSNTLHTHGCSQDRNRRLAVVPHCVVHFLAASLYPGSICPQYTFLVHGTRARCFLALAARRVGKLQNLTRKPLSRWLAAANYFGI